MIDPKKLLYSIAAVSAAAMLASCDPVNPDPGPKPEPEPEPVTMTLSFVLPSDGFKTAWKAGDEIVVHGEYAAKQVTVKLEAGDISSDGKTATKNVEGLFPYEREDCTSTLYASWPASASNNLRHCFFYSGFNPSTDTALLAAYNDGETFRFSSVSCALSFSVTGDFDGYAITGRKDAVVGYEYFQVKLTSSEQNFNQYHSSPMVTVAGSLAGGANQMVYLPGDVNLPAGFVLKLTKGGAAVKAYTNKSAAEIARGTVLDLGNITPYLEDYEADINITGAIPLGEDGTANCYIVTEPGVYRIPAVKGNTNEAVANPESASVLWETWNNTEQVTKKSVVSAAMYEGGYIYFQIPDGFHPGNALVAVKDEEGKILWSWHIWVPQTPVTSAVEENFGATAVLSRNLGALVDATIDAPTPVESFGLLYQWGRKDPFPGLGVLSGDSAVTISGSPITAVNEQVTIAGSIQNPTTLYYLKDSDWQSEGLDVASTLWGEGKKTVYDPCPAGYTMPTRNKSYGFWSGNTLVGSTYFVLNEANCSCSVGSLVFPLSGYTSHDSGARTGAGTNMLVWSGRWDSGTQNGYGFFGTAGESAKFRNQGNIRSMAGSVRCVAL